MKLIIPKKINISNKGENKFYKYFEEKFPDNWICYYNNTIDLYEFDFLLISPDRFIFLIEVKGFNENSNIKVIDHLTYKAKGKVCKSPLKQAKNYSFSIVNKFKNDNIRPFVIPVVCYPLISEEYFYNIELNNMSDRKETILEVDFSCNSVEKILNSLSMERKYKSAQINKLNDDEFKIFRGLFETEETLNIDISKEKQNSEIENHFSEIIYYKTYKEEYLSEIFEKWENGVWVNVLYNCEKEKEKIIDYFVDNYIKNNTIYNNLYNKYKREIFNLSLIKANSYKASIKLKSTEKMKPDELQFLKNETNFNIRQYDLIHEDLDLNVLVSASAGTGKTYSMIYRIAYILFKNKYQYIEAQNIDNIFSMITFTNEAADSMYEKIKVHLNNLYLITGDDYYYECLNNLNKVRISTIHKYVKYVLEEIAFYIGYQKSIKITSNAYDRKLLINKYYDDYENITKFLDLYDNNPIKTYEIEKIIKEISNQIKQKNISVSDNRNKYELETNKNDSFNFIISILELMKRVESDVEKKNYENNKIELSNLIMELSKTMDDDTKSFTKLKNKLEYLFVDEFQDTDDLQIELLLALQKLFGFKLFIVGDVKQCIYRFRGAEDQAFNKISKKIKFKRHYLRYNYRSEKSLIESINKISTTLGNKKLLNFKHTNDSLIPYFNNYEANIFIKEFSSIYEQTSLVIDYITKTVAKSNIDNIGILVRYNKEANMWKKIIEEGGFSVNSETNNNFYNTTPIIEFFKLVQALMHSRSKVYILQLFTTDYIEGSYNINILEEVNSSNIYELIPWWDETIKKLKNYPVMRVIHELIYEIKPWNYYGLNFKKNIRKEKIEYYKKTLELLFENLIFSHDTDYMTLEQIDDFLKVKILTRYSDEVSEKISNEMCNDLKIDVLTVHKAKGLEFDSVIIPNMSYEISTESKNTKVNLVYKKSGDCNEIGFKLRFNNGISISTPIFDRLIEEEEDFIAREEARLFYVAMTRAKKELALFRKNYERSNITWSKMIEEGDYN